MELTKERALERMPHPVEDQLELSIVMPCLNEAETIAACVEKGLGFLQREGIAGEVVVADNGSTDGSQSIARQLGARVVDVPTARLRRRPDSWNFRRARTLRDHGRCRRQLRSSMRWSRS